MAVVGKQIAFDDRTLASQDEQGKNNASHHSYHFYASDVLFLCDSRPETIEPVVTLRQF